MSLLRSICCFFGGRCAGEEPRPTNETTRRAAPASQADLGQKEAELEKNGKEQMSHREGSDTAKTIRRPLKALTALVLYFPHLGPSAEAQSQEGPVYSLGLGTVVNLQVCWLSKFDRA